ncbi:hypothetical protein RRG08_021603 [Elysia crispata]|uniref:Uncharacterized protein n=1 Tax=Elysia crispata TaxID=231223 RepID=A0AAE0XDP0_9GAST|nr:hypothetical protein RRG08_021603 [Elysia crispata]
MSGRAPHTLSSNIGDQTQTTRSWPSLATLCQTTGHCDVRRDTSTTRRDFPRSRTGAFRTFHQIMGMNPMTAMK